MSEERMALSDEERAELSRIVTELVRLNGLLAAWLNYTAHSTRAGLRMLDSKGEIDIEDPTKAIFQAVRELETSIAYLRGL